MTIAIYVPGRDVLSYLGRVKEAQDVAIYSYEGMVGSDMVLVDGDADDVEALVVEIDDAIEPPVTYSGLRALGEDAYTVLTGLKEWVKSRNITVTIRYVGDDEELSRQKGLPVDGFWSEERYYVATKDQRDDKARELFNEAVEHVEGDLKDGTYRVMVIDYTTHSEGEDLYDKLVMGGQ